MLTAVVPTKLRPPNRACALYVPVPGPVAAGVADAGADGRRRSNAVVCF